MFFVAREERKKGIRGQLDGRLKRLAPLKVKSAAVCPLVLENVKKVLT